MQDEEILTTEPEIVEETPQEENPFVPAPDGSLYAEVDENHKLIVINQVDAFNQGLPAIEFDMAWNGDLYEKGYAPSKPEPTHEEQRMKRAVAYQLEKDPITCHILSLRDEEQTEEVIAEIESLKAERAAKVKEIQKRYPYYD